MHFITLVSAHQLPRHLNRPSPFSRLYDGPRLRRPALSVHAAMSSRARLIVQGLATPLPLHVSWDSCSRVDVDCANGERPLTCIICLADGGVDGGDLAVPLLLPCGHSFCCGCYFGFIARQSSTVPGGGLTPRPPVRPDALARVLARPRSLHVDVSCPACGNISRASDARAVGFRTLRGLGNSGRVAPRALLDVDALPSVRALIASGALTSIAIGASRPGGGGGSCVASPHSIAAWVATRGSYRWVAFRLIALVAPSAGGMIPAGAVVVDTTHPPLASSEAAAYARSAVEDSRSARSFWADRATALDVAAACARADAEEATDRAAALVAAASAPPAILAPHRARYPSIDVDRGPDTNRDAVGGGVWGNSNATRRLFGADASSTDSKSLRENSGEGLRNNLAQMAARGSAREETAGAATHWLDAADVGVGEAHILSWASREAASRASDEFDDTIEHGTDAVAMGSVGYGYVCAAPPGHGAGADLSFLHPSVCAAIEAACAPTRPDDTVHVGEEAETGSATGTSRGAPSSDGLPLWPRERNLPPLLFAMVQSVDSFIAHSALARSYPLTALAPLGETVQIADIDMRAVRAVANDGAFFSLVLPRAAVSAGAARARSRMAATDAAARVPAGAGARRGARGGGSGGGGVSSGGGGGVRRNDGGGSRNSARGRGGKSGASAAARFRDVMGFDAGDDAVCDIDAEAVRAAVQDDRIFPTLSSSGVGSDDGGASRSGGGSVAGGKAGGAPRRWVGAPNSAETVFSFAGVTAAHGAFPSLPSKRG